MSELSLNKLKLVTKSRGIKVYRSMSKERLLSTLSKSGLVESKNSFVDKRLKKVRKDFNDERLKEIRKDWVKRFSKPQIKQIRRNFYDIKNPKMFQHKK